MGPPKYGSSCRKRSKRACTTSRSPNLSALGCVVGKIYINDVNHYLPNPGPQTITVDLSNISNADKDVSEQIWVACN